MIMVLSEGSADIDHESEERARIGSKQRAFECLDGAACPGFFLDQSRCPIGGTRCSVVAGL